MRIKFRIFFNCIIIHIFKLVQYLINIHCFLLQESHEKLARFRDAMTCKICMDHTINTAFLPCAHVLACADCAARCDRCPLCRADITQAQRIYLPTEFSETTTSIDAH